MRSSDGRGPRPTAAGVRLLLVLSMCCGARAALAQGGAATPRAGSAGGSAGLPSFSTAPAAAPDPNSAAAMIPQIQGLIAETNPLLARLRAFSDRYQNVFSVPGIKSERDQLRAELEKRLGRFQSAFDDFEARRHAEEAAKIQGAIVGVMRGLLPADPMGSYQEMKGNADFSHEIHQWHVGAQGALDNDEVAFSAADRLRFRYIFVAAVAVAACLAMGVAMAFWRKNAVAKAKLETDISRLAAATGSVYQGIGAAGPLTPANVTPTATVLGGNYHVEKEIGHGGMGVVYKARDLSLGRDVAIKKLREELHERTTDLDLLLGEARLVAALKHPNIVEIYSIFKENGRVFLVFEFVAGRTLYDILGEYKQLTLRQAKSVLRQMASALDYAHRQKVIHKDLKASNVMVSADGAVKVMDFGIAHQAQATVAKLTRSEAWGTPPYMAPEQEMGAVSRESDIYSLGVCLYEMVTGRLPFDGPNFLAQKNAMAFRPPSQVREELPAGLDAVIARALAVEPAGRFHSAAELVAAADVLPDGA